ncbi:DUF262 domain-containing protein [Promicromonospora iranensis]|uniref:DUF262 domain-containing protein n=1 Tax=Promicromonospora iranensis TaxID=1105144 RepID=UPI0023A9BD68|nr:DUF262 domain-containing HNH endonuclease family protein [Promicromonospora iranensis]
MEAHARTPRDLLEGKEHYEIPAFQRPYVWNEEDQWAPLWDDIARVAEAYVDVKERDPSAQPDEHHFLGAVVYASRKPVAGGVTPHDVIDGQQRMITLQVLLDAVHEVVEGRGHDDMAESLGELIRNGSARFAGTKERFKVWPSQADRLAFECAMDGGGDFSGEHPIIAAHQFFRAEAERWVTGKPDEDGVVPPGNESLRVEALSATLQDGLVLVAIDLTGHDDSQLIFETLNDRGTPLLKADLVKNWVFRKGERLGADVNSWAETMWAEFDTRWWREEIRQGRLIRSRVDSFLQYWLTMRRQEEIKGENTFRVFTEYAEPYMTSAESADALLSALRADADTYRALADLDQGTPEGRFYGVVIERLDLAATMPVFLWLLSKNHGVDDEQRRIGLLALESWAIRRMLLRMTTKDVNRFMVSTLKMLAGGPPEATGDRLVVSLSEQSAETRLWPSDAHMAEQLPEIRLYGNVRQDRIRVVLGAVENHLRSLNTMYEAVSLPAKLEIEHIMPQGWRAHWNSAPGLSPDEEALRDRLVNTIGNLTLVTKSLNGSLSNRPWLDVDAAGLKEGGAPNKGKWALLNEFSLLVLNKKVLKNHPEAWTDDAIVERSRALTAAICAAWPGPDVEIHEAAAQSAAAPRLRELPEIEWTDGDVERLAAEAGERLLVVLDALASDPVREWTNHDFAIAGLTDKAYAALGALTNEVRGRFQRSNAPIRYVKSGTTWKWSVSADFAGKWRAARHAAHLRKVPQDGQ